MPQPSIAKYIQKTYDRSNEWILVSETADEIFNYLSSKPVMEKIEQANAPGNSSSLVQDVVLELAKTLGFKDEKNGLFSDYDNSRLRPDYYKSIPPDTGILMEVERGKTNINNMDFLDFWKCHICRHAHYLFLIVPNELRQNDSGRISGRPFNTVNAHMKSFFIPENYTNVRGTVIFGY